ncbi:hypothetical protein C9374_002100 [Naegleria lovaniensis]|uniref:5'-3' exoribonuclease n=1 Tax=Naegleria lovaniensis TaxID=51637 RepID=A0AA88GQJ8_NAELO|nr:uncharacterized protein C9374_002100 [Naegleria lovaniensis]KAG2387065.1 hypothetical protein C9374_002100 [Naegleria lovaniensis]
MGVPGLYRYLVEKYPNIVSECVEEIPAVHQTTISSSYDDVDTSRLAEGQLPSIKKKTIRIVTQPVDTTKPNPNGKEFDNLYLDMNGIIHPCCHPEDEEAPKTEEEMYEKIFEYVERIFAAIRPRRVLFLAVDGPAPRAKQNQQRARRYKSAKDLEDQKTIERNLREELISRGMEPPPLNEEPPEKPIRIVTKKKASNAVNKDLANLLMDESDMPLNDELYDSKPLEEEEEEEEFYEIHPAGANWDSNVITPGTPFMHRLGKALRYFIHMKLSTDEGWKRVKVILSDASVPGEGEHKIMDFIRSQRELPGYNPNTSHVIHGLDADLTMLALATHEPYFYNLREKVMFGKENQGKSYDIEKKKQGAHWYEYKPLEILHISILREYLEVEFNQHIENLPFPFEFERALDDFVFICFFVGNDFLPHLPSLDIREGAIDLLLALYKESLPELGGYLTENGDVNVRRVQYLLKQVSKHEDRIFDVRAKREEQFKQQQEQRKREKEQKHQSNQTDTGKPNIEIVPILKEHRDNFNRFTNPYEDYRKKKAIEQEQDTSALGKRKKDEEDNEELEEEAPSEKKLKPLVDEATEEPASTATTNAQDDIEPLKPVKMEAKQYADVLKIRVDESKNVDTEKFPDNVKFGSEGWRARYYKEKMGIELGTDEYWDVSLKYLEGLVWVFRYYYTGCDSWGWFYPYHYAPFASDMAEVDISKLNLNFEKGAPYKPFSQLLGVLPPRSARALPPAYRELMLSNESPIKEFYPTDFNIDLNGKTKSWMGVCLLPFIDQEELSAAIKTVEFSLTPDEIERNTLGNTTLFVHYEHPLQQFVMECYINGSAKFDFSKASRDLAGVFYEDSQGVAPSDKVKVPWKSDLLDDVAETQAVSARYELPPLEKTKSKYISKLLPTVTPPPKMLPKILDSGSVPVVIGENYEKTISFCSPKEMIENIMNGRPRNNYLSVRKQFVNRQGNRDRVDYRGSSSFNRGNYDNSRSYDRNDNNRRDSYNNRGDNYSRNDYRQGDRPTDYRSNQAYDRNYSDNRNNYDNRYNNDRSYANRGDGRGSNYRGGNYDSSSGSNTRGGTLSSDGRGYNDNRNRSSYDDSNRQSSSRGDYSRSPYSRGGYGSQQSSSGSNSPYSSVVSSQNSPYSRSPYSSVQTASPYSSTTSPYASSSPYAQQSPYASSNPYSQQSPYGSYKNDAQSNNSPYSQTQRQPSQQQQYGNSQYSRNNSNQSNNNGSRRI